MRCFTLEVARSFVHALGSETARLLPNLVWIFADSIQATKFRIAAPAGARAKGTARPSLDIPSQNRLDIRMEGICREYE